MLLGAVGLTVSLAFVLLSAPDLALTQLLVEVVTIILMLLVLHYLPADAPVEPRPARRWADATLATVTGFGAAVVAWAVMTRPFDSISPYFLARSLPEAGGSNAVNVIIVDFRGFDTLGEITVLGIAGLIVFALLSRFRVPAAFVPAPADSSWNPLLLQVVTRTLLPLAAMVSVYLLLRGHNLPGGGFIAGLVLAAAVMIVRVAGGTPLPGGRRPRPLAVDRRGPADRGGHRPLQRHVRAPVPHQRFRPPGAAGDRGAAAGDGGAVRPRRLPHRDRREPARVDDDRGAAPGQSGARAMTAILVAAAIGILTATGTWLALRARTFDVVLGLTLLSYAVNLFIFVTGRLAAGAAPILRPGMAPTLAHYADPLPQALVLTAIVISFAMTAVLLALALKARFVNGDDGVDAGPDDEFDEPAATIRPDGEGAR